ncbi:MAG: tRNA (adenine-N1)-methyltransferase [Candidatus Bilamarchaeaceae archaeon]
MMKQDFHFPSFLKKLSRGPAVILPKDAGAIIAYSGIGKESAVVEAGAGSGFLTAYLGRIAKKVVSYEKDERWVAVVKENVKKLGLENVEVKHGDIFNGIEEKDVDLVVLDLPEAEKAVAHAFSSLKKGGMVVGYLPHTEQVKSFVDECTKHTNDIFTTEIIAREYEVRDRGTRPSHFGLMHTAYLVFAKK